MTQTISAALHAAALCHEGTAEWPGSRHNPAILAMFEAAGQPMADDETPWCAAFVGAVLAECGLTGTGSLAARSYLNWGVAVDLADAQPGDIVILWRGQRDGWQGHVAFFDSINSKGRLRLLGGNQGDSVSRRTYPADRLLGIRRAKPARTNPTQSTTIRASAAQIATGAGGAVSAVAALDGTAQIVACVLAGITILTALWIMRARLRHWANGLR